MTISYRDARTSPLSLLHTPDGTLGDGRYTFEIERGTLVLRDFKPGIPVPVSMPSGPAQSESVQNDTTPRWHRLFRRDPED